MDIFTTVSEVTKRAQMGVREFAYDVTKMWRASRVVCVGILGVGVLRAIGPVLGLQMLGRFIDAAIGARGVGVVTSEVREYFWTMLLVVVATFGAFVAVKKFTGLSASLIQRLVRIVEPISFFLIAWPLLQSTLVWSVVVLVFRLPFRHPVITAVTSLAVAVLSLLTVSDVLTFAATRTITIGAMVTVGGASLAFGLTVAARPYFAKLLT